MLCHLAAERGPELADICIVRAAADLDAAIPRLVTAYLTHVWTECGCGWRTDKRRANARNRLAPLRVIR